MTKLGWSRSNPALFFFWHFTPYDFDTALGTNSESSLMFDDTKEDAEKTGVDILEPPLDSSDNNTLK